MFNIENIDLSLAFSPLFFIIALLVIAAYSLYIYKHTIPEVSIPYKILLVSLRTLALILILLVIFEPVLNITKKDRIEPVNLVFVDNSKSIQIQDGTERKDITNNFLHDIKSSSLANRSEFYSFGRSVNKMSGDSLDHFSFSESVTNYSSVFNHSSLQHQNISSIIFISDGVITDGSNPIYSAEKLGIPVYTIGVGDTVRKNNLEIGKVLFNEYIYAGNPTAINIAILNIGYSDNKIKTSLFEDGVQLDSKEIILSSEGISNVSFSYTPKSAGEKKLTLAVSNLKNEITYADNKKTIFINVLNNKLNTLLLAGSPSSDLSFIKNMLAVDENLRVTTYTQINNTQFLEKVDVSKLLDSADILFLVGFPSQRTPSNLLEKVFNAIKIKNIPYFLVLSSSIDLARLKGIENELPFTIQRINYSPVEVQPQVSNDDLQNPLLQGGNKNVNDWEDMPPVFRPNSDFYAKPESNVLAKVKINNIPINSPLILTRKLGNKRSIAVLARDIWRWKLLTAEKNLDSFDRLIINSVKWLNTSEDQKMVNIRTSKKLYSPGEPVEFIAQVYDETFNPVENSELTIEVKSGNNNYQLTMNSLGSGLYEGSLPASTPGDYKYSGTANFNNKTLGRDNGMFSIGDVEIEMVNPQMDKEFLTLLSSLTGGKFYYGKEYKELIKMLENNNDNKPKNRIIKSEFFLWTNKWILFIIIFLFALEWFLRKRSGML